MTVKVAINGFGRIGRNVLRAIVADYVATREPVGSKALVDRHSLGVSSATVRNDMAVLEEEGFRFDMGPTILTVPRVLRRIFAEAGRELESELATWSDRTPMALVINCEIPSSILLRVCMSSLPLT